MVVVSAGAVVVVVSAGAVVVVVSSGAVVVVVSSGAVVVVVSSTVVVVVSSGGEVVVVLPPVEHEPSAPHASQQLDCDPTHAVPPCGGLQSSSLCLMLHIVWPCSSVRQQVTKPGRPQVDMSAHCTTSSLHSFRSDLSLTAAFATRSTQCTYLSWLRAPSQSHCSAAAARTAAISSASSDCLPQGPPRARAGVTPPAPGTGVPGTPAISHRSTLRTKNPRFESRMAGSVFPQGHGSVRVPGARVRFGGLPWLRRVGAAIP